jgi:hypothetical protein
MSTICIGNKEYDSHELLAFQRYQLALLNCTIKELEERLTSIHEIMNWLENSTD